MALKTKPFNVQNYLKTPKDQAEFMAAVFEDGDPSTIAAAIGEIARARGATVFARESGLSRETIYKQFRAGGNPRLDTLIKAMAALGLELRLGAAPKVKAA